MHPQVTFRGLFPTEQAIQAVYRCADTIRAAAPMLECCNVEIEARLTGKRGYRVVVHLGLNSHEREHETVHHATATNSQLARALHEAFAAAARAALSPGYAGRRLACSTC